MGWFGKKQERMKRMYGDDIFKFVNLVREEDSRLVEEEKRFINKSDKNRSDMYNLDMYKKLIDRFDGDMSQPEIEWYDKYKGYLRLTIRFPERKVAFMRAVDRILEDDRKEIS